ncbi:MAG TPA: hypothetical protein DCS87_00060 [Rheinheimera sp.]|nr:hypothetical protein [Rheinheimera sp.]
MHSLKKIISASVVSVVLAGCASTSNDSPATYPELKLLSNQTYVWDENISEALNVARMAQPAGPGVGMKDFSDGKKANTGKISDSTRLLDAGLGLISMGGFGVLSMESLNAGVNRQLDWKPTLVTLIPKNEIGMNPDHKQVRDYVGLKIKEAMQQSYPNLAWHGGFTHKRSFVDGNVEYLLFEKDACVEYFKFEAKEKSELKKEFFSDNRRRNFVEADPNLAKYCVYGGMLKLASSAKIKGSEYWVVTFEAANGHFFNSLMEKNYKGYVIVPEIYDFRASDVHLNIVVNNGYAKVFKNGHELLFQSK